jgi:hypothetical protein
VESLRKPIFKAEKWIKTGLFLPKSTKNAFFFNNLVLTIKIFPIFVANWKNRKRRDSIEINKITN